jgi:NitT/TauT family transport system ATP-binding protein
MQTALVSVLNVGHRYGALSAVADVSFTVLPGEFVSIVGPSGCGKTTLLKIIGGILKPTMGAVMIDGASPDASRHAGRLGFVFQRPVLLPWRTVLENVMLPFEILKREKSHTEEAVAVLAEVGLADFADSSPAELSGGMEQRAALARALVLKPTLLLMDEPFSALDEVSRERLDDELLRLTQTMGRSFIFVTHSITEAVSLSDKIIVLSNRPARVLSVISVPSERPRTLRSRSSKQFELVECIRELITR